MKRKICIVTGTRAEYGLLFWLMKALQNDPNVNFQLIVTGMHLSPEFGLTYKKIEEDGFIINKKVEMLLSSDTPVGISKSMGIAMMGISEALDELKPDLLVLLGDRFEIFSAAAAAMIARIPVAHLHGGETTEGLIDEPIRHSVTKMSHLHFTSTEEYRNRVIQLGEDPSRVFNVGALGIENINRLELLDRKNLEESIKFNLGKKSALVTYHPVTLENSSSEGQLQNLLDVLEAMPDIKVVFTKANADTDGRVINKMIDQYVAAHNNNSAAFVSLGQLRYLSLLKNVNLVIGNSSSGLIEAPSFHTPTINIGDRQRGRIKGKTVVDCEPDVNSIRDAIGKVMSPEFQSELKSAVNPYGTANASERIVPILKSTDLDEIVKKKFYNIKANN